MSSRKGARTKSRDIDERSEKEMIRRWTLRLLAANERSFTKSDLMKTLGKQLGIKPPTFYRVLNRLETIDHLVKVNGNSIISLTQKGKEMWNTIKWGDGRPSEVEKIDYRLILERTEDRIRGIIEDIKFFAERNAFPYRKGNKVVWTLLGYLYERTNSDFWVMAKGADLHHPLMELDIKFLCDKMEEFVKNPKNNLKRIQPADTWINWLVFLKDHLMYDEREKKDRDNFQLYFTEDPPQFITQVNIKDSDEMVLVPMEGLENSYCFHILDKEIIEGHRSDFKTWLARSQGALTSSKILDVFITNLKTLRELQTHCLIISEFERQYTYYSGGDEFTIITTYETAQQSFPLDYPLWSRWFENWITGDGEKLLKEYCKSDRYNNLETALCEIFNEFHKPGELFGKKSLPAIVRENFKDTTFKSILKNNNVDEAARELVKYISTHCVSDVLRKLVKVD